MSAVAEKTWTYRDYLKLDDDRRYEILEGALTEMPPAPSLEHQFAGSKLHGRILSFVEKRKLGDVFSAPTDVILDERNVVQPDLIFIAKARHGILKSRGVFGAPDLAVEILSPTSLYRDAIKKLALYRRFGVREYWLVDPANKCIEIMVPGKDKSYELFSAAYGDRPEQRAKSKILAGLEIAADEIFESYANDQPPD